MAEPQIAALFDRAIAAHESGDLRQAEVLYRQVLERNPEDWRIFSRLGLLAQQVGRDDAAVALYARSIALSANDAGTHIGLGVSLLKLGRAEQAVAAFGEAARLDPNSPENHFHLANALLAQDRLDQAVRSFHDALRVGPRVPSVLNNLGTALRLAGRMSEALAAYREAVALDPSSAQFHSNLGGVLHDQGSFDAAIAEFQQALKIDPNLIEAKGSLGMARLLRGDLAEGWRLYESRLALRARRISIGGLPFWDGSALQGRTILLHAEQGFGDTIQFVRYAAMARQRGAGKVVLGCRPELRRLLEGQCGIDRVVSEGDQVGQCDVQCMLMSLPVHFETTLQTIPAMTPYLRADAGRVEHWRQRLSRQPRAMNVGLVWAGGAHNRNDWNRSLTLPALAGLCGVGDANYISLQKGAAASQAVEPRGLAIVDWTSELSDFADTAALISALDLVISVDTSVAHLAGALGKPVWVLIPYVPDWRWMLDRTDSPWYPTMRLFRQQRPGDWNEPVGRLVEQLKTEVSRRRDAGGESGPPGPDR